MNDLSKFLLLLHRSTPAPDPGFVDQEGKPIVIDEAAELEEIEKTAKDTLGAEYYFLRGLEYEYSQPEVAVTAYREYANYLYEQSVDDDYTAEERAEFARQSSAYQKYADAVDKFIEAAETRAISPEQSRPLYSAAADLFTAAKELFAACTDDYNGYEARATDRAQNAAEIASWITEDIADGGDGMDKSTDDPEHASHPDKDNKDKSDKEKNEGGGGGSSESEQYRQDKAAGIGDDSDIGIYIFVEDHHNDAMCGCYQVGCKACQRWDYYISAISSTSATIGGYYKNYDSKSMKIGGERVRVSRPHTYVKAYLIYDGYKSIGSAARDAHKIMHQYSISAKDGTQFTNVKISFRSRNIVGSDYANGKASERKSHWLDN